MFLGQMVEAIVFFNFVFINVFGFERAFRAKRGMKICFPRARVSDSKAALQSQAFREKRGKYVFMKNTI